MRLDWADIAKAIWAVVLLVVGALVNRLLEQKPRLTYYASHWSAYPLPGPPAVTVHTHGIVVRNAGRKTAADVRLRHNLRPETFYVSPQVQYTDPDMPGGGFEIVLPRLVPQEEVAVSYMHTQPFNNFRGQITHSDRVALGVSAIPTAQYPA